MNPQKQRERRKISSAVALAMGAVTAISPSAWSSSLPDVSVFANAREVSDEAMGEMRGRFISRDQIVQFGVEMRTTWETAKGEILQATANLNVANVTANVPTVTYAPNLTIVSPSSVDATPAGPAATQVVGTGAGLRNVTGVTQAIQVAGDGNSVGQDTNIVITSRGAPAPAGSPATPGTQSLTSSTGASVSASLSSNGLSVEARIPNQGEVIQQIRGTGFSGQSAAGVIQSTRLATDLQRIRNAINITVQVAPGAALQGATPGGSLQNLRGLRPMGAF